MILHPCQGSPTDCPNHLDNSSPQRWQSASGLSSALSCLTIVLQIAPCAHSDHRLGAHIDSCRFRSQRSRLMAAASGLLRDGAQPTAP